MTRHENLKDEIYASQQRATEDEAWASGLTSRVVTIVPGQKAPRPVHATLKSATFHRFTNGSVLVTRHWHRPAPELGERGEAASRTTVEERWFAESLYRDYVELDGFVVAG